MSREFTKDAIAELFKMATKIIQLEAENEELKKRLEPFKKIEELPDGSYQLSPVPPDRENK